MKPIWQILQPSQLGDTLEDVKSALGGFTTKMALDLQRILGNGATFKDNLATAYIEFDAIDGTEMPVANPFKGVPQAFIPISAFTLVGGVGGRNNGVQLAMSGQPILNLSRTDGYLGITVNYAPPVETQRITRARSASTAMVSATPKNICATPSVVLTAGDWLVSGAIGFNTTGGAVTTFLDASISLGTGALSGADTICLPTSGEARNYNNENHTGSDYSVFIPPYRTSVAAASTKTLFLVGNIVTAAAAASAYGNLEAVRLTTDPATTARVRGILVEA